VADTVADLAGALDLLLTDAALGPLRRLLPGVSWVRFAAHLAARPGTVARRGTDLARELARIGWVNAAARNGPPRPTSAAAACGPRRPPRAPTCWTTEVDATRDVTVDGMRIRVCIRRGADPGSRPPLLLCNGIGAGLELLQPFVDALDPALEVIRFDVPGVGGSPTPRRPYLLVTLAGRTARMLRQLGYGQVDVLGLSWGGGLAQQLAFSHRRLVRRLVLVSTATGAAMVPARPAVLARMVTPQRYRDPRYAAGIAPLIYGGEVREHPELVRELFTRPTGRGSYRGYTYQLLAGAGWTSLPWLRLLRQPTLILAGDDDRIIPLANAQIMHRLIPRSRLHIYHGGHVTLVTRATALAPVVAAFLAEADPSGRPPWRRPPWRRPPWPDAAGSDPATTGSTRRAGRPSRRWGLSGSAER